MPMATVAVTLAATWAGLAACKAPDTGGLPGTWGNDNAAKAECGALGRVCLVNPLNAPLAVGSATELRLDIATQGGTGLAIELASADVGIIEVDGLTVTAMAPGAAAVMFMADGTVLDWMFMFAEPIDGLRIVIFSQQGDLLGFATDTGQLIVGDQAYFSIAPYAGGAPLSGNFPLDIDVAGDAVRVVPDLTNARYRLIAVGAGTSTITFSGLDQEIVWTLEVSP